MSTAEVLFAVLAAEVVPTHDDSEIDGAVSDGQSNDADGAGATIVRHVLLRVCRQFGNQPSPPANPAVFVSNSRSQRVSRIRIACDELIADVAERVALECDPEAEGIINANDKALSIAAVSHPSTWLKGSNVQSQGSAVIREEGKHLSNQKKVVHVLQIGLRFYAVESQTARDKVVSAWNEDKSNSDKKDGLQTDNTASVALKNLSHLVQTAIDLYNSGVGGQALPTSMLNEPDDLSSSKIDSDVDKLRQQLTDADADGEIIRMLFSAIKTNTILESKLVEAQKMQDQTLKTLGVLSARLDAQRVLIDASVQKVQQCSTDVPFLNSFSQIPKLEAQQLAQQSTTPIDPGLVAVGAVVVFVAVLAALMLR
ncbi:hypothetical protein HDU83_009486 [Entophlyctis luteolus]|nr:hypothetical protein HDU83_009486 [Entophlyctis luteolus]